MSDKPKVLIVDDDYDILDLFEIFLYNEFEVTTAINGFEGLAKAQETTPHCVITDIMMPVMDGIKFINRFHKNSLMADIPVIAITAFHTTIQQESLKGVGFAAVVSKPVTQKVLINTVKNVLEDN